jgi:hypothetical protein
MQQNATINNKSPQVIICNDCRSQASILLILVTTNYRPTDVQSHTRTHTSESIRTHALPEEPHKFTDVCQHFPQTDNYSTRDFLKYSSTFFSQRFPNNIFHIQPNALKMCFPIHSNAITCIFTNLWNCLAHSERTSNP